VLQCVAVCCSALQCVAIWYSVLQDDAVLAGWCSVLQCVAVCCSVFQCVAVLCSVLQNDAVLAGWCSVLQCVAVCCRVMMSRSKPRRSSRLSSFHFYLNAHLEIESSRDWSLREATMSRWAPKVHHMIGVWNKRDIANDHLIQTC